MSTRPEAGARGAVRWAWIAALVVAVVLLVRHYAISPLAPAAVPGSSPEPAGAPTVSAPAVAVDPAGSELAARLHAGDASADDDLRVLDDLLKLYRRTAGGNPEGLNEEITAALTGGNDQKRAVLPPDHPALRDGRLTDRWGTPYFFHPLSGDRMELRSAGPDRQLFTPDDVTWP